MISEQVNCGGCSLHTEDAYCRIPVGPGARYRRLPPFGVRHRDCPKTFGSHARAFWDWQRLVGR